MIGGVDLTIKQTNIPLRPGFKTYQHDRKKAMVEIIVKVSSFWMNGSFQIKWKEHDKTMMRVCCRYLGNKMMSY